MTEFDKSTAARERELRLFLIATGTLATAHLPFWLNWLEANRPRYDVTVGLTDSAHRFVSATALAALTGHPTVANTWDDGSRLTAVHTTIAAGHDAIAVFPASVAFLSGLAAGSGTSPFFLAALGTDKPVVLAPSYPPGVGDNPLVRDVVARLDAVPNYHVVTTQKGVSRSTGAETDVVAPMWDVIAAVEPQVCAA